MRIFITAATMMVAIGLIGCGEKEDDTAEETATEETGTASDDTGAAAEETE
jgi:hypothetical protein